MAERNQYEELVRQISAIGAVKRDMARRLPHDCPAGSAAVLMLLNRHGEMRLSGLAELMAVDMSVVSRHVAHAAERGWIERLPDPQDGRVRLLRINDEGERLLDDLSERTTLAMERRLSDWSDEDVAQLIALLHRLRTSFGDCRTRGPQPHDSAPPREDAQEITTTAP